MYVNEQHILIIGPYKRALYNQNALWRIRVFSVLGHNGHYNIPRMQCNNK